MGRVYETAEAPFDHDAGADLDRLPAVVETDVLPCGVPHRRILDAGEKAHHPAVQLSGAPPVRSKRHRHHPGHLGVHGGQGLLVHVPQVHADLAPLPLGQGVPRVLRRVAAPDGALWVHPLLRAQAGVEVEGHRRRAAVEDAPPPVGEFVVDHDVAARGPQEGDPVPGFVFAAPQHDAVGAPLRVGQAAGGIQQVVPGPGQRGIGHVAGVEQVLAEEQDPAQGPAVRQAPDVGRPVRTLAADHRLELGVHAEAECFLAQPGQVAVFRPVEGVEEPFADVVVGLAEIHVEHVGGKSRRDGHEVGFHALDLDAGEPVQFDLDPVPVVDAVAPGVGPIPIPIPLREAFGERLLEAAHGCHLGAGERVRTGSVGQIEKFHVDDGAVRSILDPPGSGNGATGEVQHQGQDHRLENSVSHVASPPQHTSRAAAVYRRKATRHVAANAAARQLVRVQPRHPAAGGHSRGVAHHALLETLGDGQVRTACRGRVVSACQQLNGHLRAPSAEKHAAPMDVDRPETPRHRPDRL